MELWLPHQGTLADRKLSRGSALKLHSLVFSGLQIRDAAAIYSRVEVSK